ncbi:unnamed protein product [Clonostachys chloroleuca]|uniref:Beta-xylosidase C-terminal Concanavalin A-like domain-containing protein n=1 Tax=Clonostachys chloroleuca TaxID=1926264 RepID=A0AA35LP45_9HYPO|nr:unnamed protein product [Clonostachys chloroleuca]
MFLKQLLAIGSGLLIAAAQTFSNAVIWEDLPDNEVTRVDNAFYMTASSFHLSPGAPILRSYDLVNWEPIGHSVPTLDFGPSYDMTDSQTAYVAGIWASTLRHREFNNKWYFLACVGFSKTYIYIADEPEGTWTRHSTINQCFYDAGLLFEGEAVYVAYGNNKINVAQLSTDLTSVVANELVFETPTDIGALEGSRMYRRDGNYYIFLTRPPNAQYTLKSSSPWGPFKYRVLCDNIALSSVPGGDAPHQGSLYMGFTDIYPGGRAPVLAPITWGDDGFPTLMTTDGEWGNYSYPLPEVKQPDTLGLYEFRGSVMGPQWQWNHNPNTSSFTVNNGLELRTASITQDIYLARNTLTHRIRGPVGTGTIHLDFTRMADGDRAGLSLFRDDSAMIGMEREGDSWSLVARRSVMDERKKHGESVQELARVDNVAFREVWLRVSADVHPNRMGQGLLSFSTDNLNFAELARFDLRRTWPFFLGYRYGIYNYATKGFGGLVRVSSFLNEVANQ